METPSCDLVVDPREPEEDLRAAVRRVCKLLVKDWADIDQSTFNVSTITGGITNLLLKVSVDGKGLSLDAVTVRIFGVNTEAVIDRNRELQVCTQFYYLFSPRLKPL
jgi:ethanolamine kinase